MVGVHVQNAAGKEISLCCLKMESFQTEGDRKTKRNLENDGKIVGVNPGTN